MRNRNYIVITAVAAVSVLFAACGGNGSPSEPEVSPGHVVVLTASPANSAASRSSDMPENSYAPAAPTESGYMGSTSDENGVSCDYDITDLNEVKYAKAYVNVRSGPGSDYSKIGSLSQNDQVKVTGRADDNGWYRIEYDGSIGFVSDNYLVDEKTSEPEAAAEKPQDSGGQVSGGSDTRTQSSSRAGTGSAELDRLCDDILNNIVSSDMSERDKAYAVYTWVSGSISYRGTSATGDWVAGAKTALTRYSGDCYAFYSASRALLTRLGFENTEEKSYTEGHFWNMVKVDGSWWHFDTTPGWGTERFLWTSDQINNYSYYSEKYGKYITYKWNPEGCPATP